MSRMDGRLDTVVNGFALLREGNKGFDGRFPASQQDNKPELGLGAASVAEIGDVIIQPLPVIADALYPTSGFGADAAFAAAHTAHNSRFTMHHAEGEPDSDGGYPVDATLAFLPDSTPAHHNRRTHFRTWPHFRTHLRKSGCASPAARASLPVPRFSSDTVTRSPLPVECRYIRKPALYTRPLCAVTPGAQCTYCSCL
ncbi:unnamed protein product [Tilletia controversa]|nr:unnamed protein product [Tilletia controversa]